MEFKKFSVERESYGKNAGKLLGTITLKDATKKVEFVLPPEVCEEIVKVSAEALYDGATEVAEQLREQLLEFVDLKALPEKRDNGAVV